MNGIVQLSLKLQFAPRAADRSKSTKTLNQQHLKGKKPCPFHSSVNSPSRNQDESITLAIDQLRLFRKALCHTPKPTLGLAKFNNFIHLVKDAFTDAGSQ